MLGQVVNTGPHRYRAVWPDREGVEWSTERTAVATPSEGFLDEDEDGL